jgi:hypothetical protein
MQVGRAAPRRCHPWHTWSRKRTARRFGFAPISIPTRRSKPWDCRSRRCRGRTSRFPASFRGRGCEALIGPAWKWRIKHRKMRNFSLRRVPKVRPGRRWEHVHTPAGPQGKGLCPSPKRTGTQTAPRDEAFVLGARIGWGQIVRPDLPGPWGDFSLASRADRARFFEPPRLKSRAEMGDPLVEMRRPAECFAREAELLSAAMIAGAAVCARSACDRLVGRPGRVLAPCRPF